MLNLNKQQVLYKSTSSYLLKEQLTNLFGCLFFDHLLEPQLLKLISCGLHERYVSIPTTADS